MGQSSPLFHHTLFPWFGPYSHHTHAPKFLHLGTADHRAQNHHPLLKNASYPSHSNSQNMTQELIFTEKKGGISPRTKALALLPQFKNLFMQLNGANSSELPGCVSVFSSPKQFTPIVRTQIHTTYQSKPTPQIHATSKQELNAAAHDWGTSLPSREHCPVGNKLLEELTGAKG